ncbi:tRNA (guanine(10)-N2)-methyltransferase homolog [Folsomia candida]|uniref:tRNA (guanine(10)-N2)-methyltransferase homolog n=1 Tax=Folsomia candida TaxID=158441 RepID=UPI000B8FC426|nr:tRNA (guanine(10)-N2)-methyltransferase homolog [Folsomia candida]
MRLSIRALSSAMSSASRTFLFWFSNEHSGFRIQEMEALFKVFKLDNKSLNSRIVNGGPFMLMDFPDDDGPKKLMSRSVLIHSCYELLGDGKSREEMDNTVKKNLPRMAPYVNNTFQIRVETYGKTMQHAEKIQFIDTLDYLPMEGKVDLKNPECSLHLIMYYGLDANRIPEEPYHWYFGRWIMNGQRKLASKTSLKTRKFIGNTSMDPLLSLLMVNLAAIKEYDIILDPFVGTGSILVAAAAIGGQVLGSDIDYLMLHGKTKPTKAFKVARDEGENIRANMIQYGFENRYLDVIISDASRQMWRTDFRVDAIITDPPYGIREPTFRIGPSRPQKPDFKIKEEHLEKHIPAKQDYSLTEIFRDLMDFAVHQLEIGGRLVYWIPISRPDYEEDKLPKNPCLQLLFNTEQIFNSVASRRLLVFEKTKEATTLCQTELDTSALMYRAQLFDSETDPNLRKIKKEEAFSMYGRGSKRGHERPPTSHLHEMTI